MEVAKADCQRPLLVKVRSHNMEQATLFLQVTLGLWRYRPRVIT
jgi:hypothetical protein